MKKYLIIPAMPTPNGPLHLGHIGGPYLRADILARYLRQLGHQVTVLSGTDNFENYTERQAVKERCSPAEICEKYYPQIRTDLIKMNIELDDFINPHDEQWLTGYQSWCFKLLERAVSSGHVRFESGDYYLDLPTDVDLNNKGISLELINAYQKYLAVNNHSVILTSDSTWGLKVSEQKSLLSYGFIYAYYLLLAEYAREHFQEDKYTETTIIATFGADNTVPVLASVLGFSASLPTHKPVDYYIINYFYHMNGKKLSTSSRHAIWVKDICEQNVSIDILRIFLASIDVSSSVGNFSLEQFLVFQSEISADIDGWLRCQAYPLRSPHPDGAALYARIDAALQPDQFKPHLAVQAIREWMARGAKINHDSEEYGAWLQVLGVAVAPFMPELAQQIRLMMEGESKCANMI